MRGPVTTLSFPYPRGAIACVIDPWLQKGNVWAVNRSFEMNYCWFRSVVLLFSLPGFEISSSAPGSRRLQFLHFGCRWQRRRRREWLATKGWSRSFISKFNLARNIFLIPDVCVERLPRVRGRDGQPAPKATFLCCVKTEVCLGMPS